MTIEPFSYMLAFV